ncbi:MAG: hypothetical protein IPJ71_19805 [Bdellovibrionales bacterium]|nr:hypothetical protein [Bdellovibrionales bacterium]
MDKYGFHAPAHHLKNRIVPNRQVLHGRRDLKVVIFDPKGIAENHAGESINVAMKLHLPTWYRLSMKQNPSLAKKEWTLEFKNLRVRAEKDNHIHQVCHKPKSTSCYSVLAASECQMDCQIQQIATTEDFTFQLNSFDRIDRLSPATSQFNLSLLAGLVMQESTFNLWYTLG